MSGGAWNYQQFPLEDLANDVAGIVQLLALIEHELDWGVSGDNCRECAERRVIAGLIRYFETRSGGDEKPRPIDVLTIDHGDTRCPRCAERRKALP